MTIILYLLNKIVSFYCLHRVNIFKLIRLFKNKWFLFFLTGYTCIKLYRNSIKIPFQLLPYLNKKLINATIDIKEKSQNQIVTLNNKIREKIDIDINRLPLIGLSDNIIIDYINIIKEHDTTYKLISGCIYDSEENIHKNIMMRAYEQYAYSNPMHGDIYNSVVFMERNIISMIGFLLHNNNPCGTITNGGTESLFLAIKSYRDLKHTHLPNVVVPDTVHCSIDKICHYLCIKVIKVATDKEHRVCANKLMRYINNSTIAVILSAPSYGFGVMDDVATIAPILFSKNIPLHVDACLGGFIWMFLENGYSEKYGFNNQGVTSISVCLHKYGYAQKGVSSIIYRDEKLLKSQYFATNDWDGGFYVSPSFSGSRSGGLVAQAWVGMLSRGLSVYKSNAINIINLSVYTIHQLGKINGITVFPRDLHIICFSYGNSTYKLYDFLCQRGFLLNALQNPSAIHICITLQHTKSLIDELCNEIVAFINSEKSIVIEEGIAPIYGMRSGLPIYANEIINVCLKLYLSSKYSNNL
jgi:sphinganine-1-phosphate aldolase